LQQFGLYNYLATETNSKFNRYKKKLASGRESAYLSQELSRIVCDIEEYLTLTPDDLLYSINHEYLLEELAELEIRARIS